MQATLKTTLKAIPSASDSLPVKPTQKLGHLPGAKGHWLTGNMKDLLPNLGPFVRQQHAQHGACFTFGLFRNARAVMMVGPDANRQILLDKEDNFSSQWGWELLQALFGRNILVRDFADHHQHRRLMTHVFKPKVLSRYLEQINPIISKAMLGYSGPVDVYVQTKQMALDIALEVFAGIPTDADNQRLNQDLNTVLSNAMAQRIRLPGTAYSRALQARDRVRERLTADLQHRRTGGGADLFSQLASQRDEDGAMLSDSDVIDHMFGMLFAAHDTTASSLAMIFWLLARHPEWQEQLRTECTALFQRTGSRQLAYEDLDQLPKVDWVFKEALRLYSPIQLIPRRSVRDFEFEGLQIPANTALYLVPQAVHFDPQYFPDPDRFDPSRFSTTDTTNQGKNPFAFVPFGRGSHMCIGMHFAHIEIKAVMYQLLLSRELRIDPSTELELEYLPIVRPSKPMIVEFNNA